MAKAINTVKKYTLDADDAGHCANEYVVVYTDGTLQQQFH